jgi:hypothetical protein
MKVLATFTVLVIAISACGTRVTLGSIDDGDPRLTPAGIPGFPGMPPTSCAITIPIAPSTCTDMLYPVCGCDGRTYQGACEAARFVIISRPGECCLQAAPPTASCSDDGQPVCGCDGQTYAGKCAALQVVTHYMDGACNDGLDAGNSNANPPAAAGVSGENRCAVAAGTSASCPPIYEPVCGCDRRTYSNVCIAKQFVESFSDGACY